MPIMTAGEVVDMAADLLLPEHFSNDVRRQQARDTMAAMGLTRSSTTLVSANHDQSTSG